MTFYLNIENLQAEFVKQKFNFQFKSGKIYLITGKNGAGKSTFAQNMLMTGTHFVIHFLMLLVFFQLLDLLMLIFIFGQLRPLLFCLLLI